MLQRRGRHGSAHADPPRPRPAAPRPATTAPSAAASSPRPWSRRSTSSPSPSNEIVLQATAFQGEWRELLASYVGRPTPLGEARRLARAIDPEGASLGAALAEARGPLPHRRAQDQQRPGPGAARARRWARRRIIAETGAGQHGVATATACALFGLPCEVYMGAEDVKRQAPNVGRMRLLGREGHPGRERLAHAQGRDERGAARLGHERTHDVLLHRQRGRSPPLPRARARPCRPSSARRRARSASRSRARCPTRRSRASAAAPTRSACSAGSWSDDGVALVGVEAAGEGVATGRHAATLGAGRVGVLHGSKSYVLCDDGGQIKEAHSISAGLDYPGVGPEHAWLKDSGRATYVSATDDEALAAVTPGGAHRGHHPGARDGARLRARRRRRARPPSAARGRPVSIVLGLSGRGDKDLATLLARLP